MKTDDFDYDLPEALIAQAPAEPRDSCRLLVLDREDGSVEHRTFTDIVDYLEPGDLLVANKTRVLPARLVGRKPTGAVSETLLLRRREDVDPLGGVWECLVNPGKRLKPGAVIEYRAGGLHAPEGAEVVLTGEVMDFVEGSKGGRLVVSKGRLSDEELGSGQKTAEKVGMRLVSRETLSKQRPRQTSSPSALIAQNAKTSTQKSTPPFVAEPPLPRIRFAQDTDPPSKHRARRRSFAEKNCWCSVNSLIYSCFELSEEREFASTLTLRQGAVLFLEGTGSARRTKP